MRSLSSKDNLVSENVPKTSGCSEEAKKSPGLTEDAITAPGVTAKNLQLERELSLKEKEKKSQHTYSNVGHHDTAVENHYEVLP